MTDIKYRKKIICGCCGKEKYCNEIEVRMYVFKEHAVNIKAEDWCCRECRNKLINMVKSMRRVSLSPKEWLEKVEGMAYKDVLKEIEEEKDDVSTNK